MQRNVAISLMQLAVVAFAGCTDPTEPMPPVAHNADRFAITDDFTTANNIGPSPLNAPIPIGIEVVATGLTSPVQLVQPDKISVRFVIDQIGLIRMITEDGTLLPQPFLDLRSRITPLRPGSDERGLLGLAFHPDFRKNGRFFVFYTVPPRPGAPAGYDHTNIISEFHANVVAGPNKNKVMPDEVPVADPASERELLAVNHPFFNHDGGTVAFGPDGYLYISIG